MTRYQFDRPHRLGELLREFEAAGFPGVVGIGFPRLTGRDDTLWVEAEPEEYDAIAAVINAHDPAAYEQADATRLTQYRQDKQRLRDFLAAANTSITLLALVAVVKSLVRVLIYKWRELERDDE